MSSLTRRETASLPMRRAGLRIARRAKQPTWRHAFTECSCYRRRKSGAKRAKIPADLRGYLTVTVLPVTVADLADLRAPQARPPIRSCR
jgi:hypothetical protein